MYNYRFGPDGLCGSPLIRKPFIDFSFMKRRAENSSPLEFHDSYDPPMTAIPAKEFR